MHKLIRLTTVPVSLDKLLEGQLNFMSAYYEVVAISGASDLLTKVANKEGVRVIPITFTRTISPIKDIIAVIRIYRIFRFEKPFIVHTHTPKAGTLGMLAALLARVPNRLHTVAGLPLLEITGMKRKLLDIVEKFTYMFATKVYPNSFGLYDVILKNKYANKEKLKVIGNGSSNGIDTSFFNPDLVKKETRERLKEELGISEKDFVFIYIGRLVKDKGINELVEAFKSLNQKYPAAKLLLIGNFEKDLYPIKNETEVEIKNNNSIIFAGYQSDVRAYYAVSDVLTFPSYREGFPNVPMQASAMGIPSIVTDINGCNEIIEDGVNGFIIPVKDTKALYDKMEYLFLNRNVTLKMGSLARIPICEKYERTFVWNEILKEYRSLEQESMKSKS